MSNENLYVYIDESGTAALNLEKSGVSRFYVLTAIQVPESKLSAITDEALKIRDKYFPRGEIKSNKISPKEAHRRLKILNDIQALDFRFRSLVVDKSALFQDSGLSFKKSFIKYFLGSMCGRVIRMHPFTHIFADSHGRPEFRRSLESYILERHTDLFKHDSNFQTVESKDNVLIQLADFIAGTTAHFYEEKSPASVKEAYRGLVKSHCIEQYHWLKRLEFSEPTLHPDDPLKDHQIHSHAVRLAKTFICEHEKTLDPDIQKKILTLRYLLLESQFSLSPRFILAQELAEHLQDHGIPCPEQSIIRQVIPGLRDEGIIIASSKQGYKIPNTFSDILRYIEHVEGIAIPLLKRLNGSRHSYKVAHDLDILFGTQHNQLDQVLDVLDKSSRKSQWG